MPTPQGDFSDHAVHAELDLWFGGAALTPPTTLYFGLSTRESFHLSAQLAEPAGGGYARVAVANNLTNFPAAVGRTKRNAVVVVFPTPTGDWTLTGEKFQSWFAADALSAGQVIVSGILPIPLEVHAGDEAPRFEANTLVFGK